MPDAVRFEPAALTIGSGWYLRVTLPNGEHTKVHGFFSESEARNWVAEESAGWLAHYRRGRRVPSGKGG